MRHLIIKMSTKICVTCNLEKDLSMFNSQNRKYGIYYLIHCKDCFNKKNREKYKTDGNWKNRLKKYEEKNKEKIKNYQSKYHKSENVSKRRNEKRRNRRKNDEQYRLYCNTSSRIFKLISRNKSKKTIELLGTNLNFLRKWLEWQFDSNMCWDNYGTYWHIDHVRPCNSFDLTNIDEQMKCFNWKNLRPMKAEENIIKSDKIDQNEIILQENKVIKYMRQNQIAGNSLES